jgi:Domain of unknown function (DUF1707)
VVNESTRASDNDRNDTCQVLDAALEDGQLSAEEHRERVGAATKAATLGELGTLVSDLQIRATPARSPALKLPTRRVAIAAAAGVVLAAFGISWTLTGDNQSGTKAATTSAPKTTAALSISASVPAASITPTPPPPELLTLTGVTGVLAQMRTQFGDTLGYQLNIYEDHALLYRPDTANAHKVVDWMFRNGTWTNLGATASLGPDAGIGDLGRFDVQAVLGVVKTAPQTLQLYDAPERTLVLESLKDGTLSVSILVSDATKRSGSIEVGPDGAVKTIERPAR